MLHQTLPECYNKRRVQLTFRRANSCLIKYRLAQLMYVAALHDWWNRTNGWNCARISHHWIEKKVLLTFFINLKSDLCICVVRALCMLPHLKSTLLLSCCAQTHCLHSESAHLWAIFLISNEISSGTASVCSNLHFAITSIVFSVRFTLLRLN